MGTKGAHGAKGRGKGKNGFGGGHRRDAKRNGLSQAIHGGGSGGSATTSSNRPGSAIAMKERGSKQRTAQQLSQKREELRLSKVNRHRLQASSLEELVGQAAQSSKSFEQQQFQKELAGDDKKKTEIDINDNSRRAYMKELRKVVDRADVILEVLDARDPMGCRTVDMEEAIGNRSGKKIVLVLNKIDLVPPHVLQPWLTYLRTFYPTVAFKASTQQQASHISASFGKADKATSEMVTGSKAVGTDALMQLLKNYCRNSHIKTAITVGVIGYPNVGKSSVINSLKRSKAASVSSVAGHTKVMQEVHIDSKIKLLDCPGIVFDHSDSNALLLRNCVNTETMADPVSAVQVILSRCEPAQLVQLYGLDPQTTFSDVIEFLVLVAQTKGKLGKGGIPDRHAAARIILQDWNRGRIPFFTPPPDQKVTILDTQLVTSFSNEFDLDTVLNPTSIFLAEEAESGDVDMTKPSGAGPTCSVEVTAPETTGHSSADHQPTVSSRLREVLGDSDDSDSDMGSDDDAMDDLDTSGAMYQVPNLSLQQLTAKFASDPLNPLSAQMARRKAKQWRKLKRRTARQQIGHAAESELNMQLEGMDFRIGGSVAPAEDIDEDL
jgi:nuclear GTP-binding protein